jgi:hypothetical protein
MYSIDNINSNPQLNFSNSLLNSDFISSNMPNIGNDDDVCNSPYSDLNIQCNYMDINQYTA